MTKEEKREVLVKAWDETDEACYEAHKAYTEAEEAWDEAEEACYEAHKAIREFDKEK